MSRPAFNRLRDIAEEAYPATLVVSTLGPTDWQIEFTWTTAVSEGLDGQTDGVEQTAIGHGKTFNDAARDCLNGVA